MRGLLATGIRCRRGTRQVLDGVSLEAQRGECVAIAGPSGAGKSTLLAILGLQLPPDTGTIELDGLAQAERLRGRDRLRAQRSIGWVFQTTNAHGRRTVIDNVAMPAVLRGEPRQVAMQRAQAALDKVGIGDLATAQARHLSGGELQRVNIAGAMAGSAALVLADEPTGQLDETTTQQVLESLRRTTSHAAVIIASHDPKVFAIADRVAHLRNGVLT